MQDQPKKTKKTAKWVGVTCLSSFVDDGTVESHRYYLARRTVLEMLKDRGYAVPNSEIQLSLLDFRNSYGPIPDPDRLRILAALRSDPSKKITDLLVNITKHVLKPKHQILTDREKHKLLKKYNVEEKQLPRMLATDVGARYYGLRRGQVVRVTYSGEITQSHVTYWCVW